MVHGLTGGPPQRGRAAQSATCGGLGGGPAARGGASWRRWGGRPPRHAPDTQAGGGHPPPRAPVPWPWPIRRPLIARLGRRMQVLARALQPHPPTRPRTFDARPAPPLPALGGGWRRECRCQGGAMGRGAGAREGETGCAGQHPRLLQGAKVQAELGKPMFRACGRATTRPEVPRGCCERVVVGGAGGEGAGGAARGVPAQTRGQPAWQVRPAGRHRSEMCAVHTRARSCPGQPLPEQLEDGGRRLPVGADPRPRRSGCRSSADFHRTCGQEVSPWGAPQPPHANPRPAPGQGAQSSNASGSGGGLITCGGPPCGAHGVNSSTVRQLAGSR